MLLRLVTRLAGDQTFCFASRGLKQIKPNVHVPSLLERTGYSLGLGKLRYPSSRLRSAGENMFAVCAEYPVFEEFVDRLNLPDTFQSWFSITSLHVWLCLVRLRKEGTEGQLLKKTFVNIFWLDLKSRMRTFKVLKGHHRQITAFRDQFFGAMFAYDEGFLSHSDPHMVAALWRNLFLSSTCTTAGQLELALEYCRKNLKHLDAIPSQTILGYGTPTFIPLTGEKIDERVLFPAPKLL
ncbi:unnamed protein product [Calicophoron daubneyi]|uniref:Ubiquinol-cytochrome c chaperone domain-containing protein n=1 Tax=Calicophoron daubneyi TaxID=300641 RepID=A0AAV2TFD6_CALDB